MGNIQRGYFDLNKIEYLSENDEVEENMAHYGDFLFNTRNTLLLVGKGATWFGNSDEYAFNSNIARFIFKEINTIFFNYLYNTPEVIKQVQARAVGTTSVAAVYPRDLNSLIFSIPTLQEQEEIGAFFKSLDNTIALHQENLEKLKQLKKAYLQMMFPQNGEKVPRLRFANFYQEWEQHKLGESINFRNGRAYKQEELLDEGKYRVLRVGNFNTNDRWYYSNLELDGNKYASQGDLLYLWATSFGPKIWNEETVIYHYHIWKLEIIDTNIDKQYLYTYLETDKERIQQTTNGTTMFHITKGNMEEREFQYPKEITEQEKIGYIIQQLDNVTNLYYEKLEKIKKLKKFYLQSLFV